MKLAISLLRANPKFWPDIAIEAEQLGFESVWIGEHLVLPSKIDASQYPDTTLPINPATPVFDPFVMLTYLAGLTTALRLGTYVYQLGLRHPFVSARAVASLEAVSGGRLELGVGAGWLRDEWEASEVPFQNRGRRLDEALEICRNLWSAGPVGHTGEFFRFPEVAFEPTPAKQPRIHVGGESPQALRRAIRFGDGWAGMHHDPSSANEPLHRLRQLAEKAGRPPLETTVAAHPGPDIDVEAWRRTGLDRLIVAPWRRSADAVSGMRSLASALG
jgi:probable F420-dependent oxidoreductase